MINYKQITTIIINNILFKINQIIYDIGRSHSHGKGIMSQVNNFPSPTPFVAKLTTKLPKTKAVLFNPESFQLWSYNYVSAQIWYLIVLLPSFSDTPWIFNYLYSKNIVWYSALLRPKWQRAVYDGGPDKQERTLGRGFFQLVFWCWTWLRVHLSCRQTRSWLLCQRRTAHFDDSNQRNWTAFKSYRYAVLDSWSPTNSEYMRTYWKIVLRTHAVQWSM